MQRLIITFIVGLALTALSLPTVVMAKSGPTTVVLFPFDAQRAGKYSVLGDAMGNMVAGRLATLKNIVLLENSLDARQQHDFVEQFPQNSRSVFELLGTEFVGAGLITAEDGKLQLKMSFFKKEASSPIIVQAEAENEQMIMKAVDQLLNNIDDEVFGETRAKQKKPSLTTSEGIEAFQTEHPDRKYKEEIISGSAVFVGDQGGTISRDEIYRRTSKLPTGLIALALADADGDGITEIIVASQDDIRALRYHKGILKELSRKQLEPSTAVHAMNIADLNGDGKSEILISAVSKQDLASSVYAWQQDSGFEKIMGDIPWAIRPVAMDDNSVIIVGQKESAAEESFLEPGLWQLELDLRNGNVEVKDRLFLPGSFNLFDFVYADLDGNGSKERVAITSELNLAVYDQNNRLIWVSEKDYGGNVTYLGSRWREKEGKSSGFLTHDDEIYYELQYVPVRLIAQDVNNDGRTDIIAAKNNLATFKALSNLRSFKGGSVVCLGWNGARMSELWQTDTLDGYVADLYFENNKSSIGDMSLSAKNSESSGARLVVGQVPNDGFADIFNFAADQSKLVVYEFKIVAETGASIKSDQ